MKNYYLMCNFSRSKPLTFLNGSPVMSQGGLYGPISQSMLDNDLSTKKEFRELIASGELSLIESNKTRKAIIEPQNKKEPEDKPQTQTVDKVEYTTETVVPEEKTTSADVIENTIEEKPIARKRRSRKVTKNA